MNNLPANYKKKSKISTKIGTRGIIDLFCTLPIAYIFKNMTLMKNKIT